MTSRRICSPANYSRGRGPGFSGRQQNCDPIIGQRPIIGANWAKFSPFLMTDEGRIKVLPEECMVNNCIVPLGSLGLIYGNTHLTVCIEVCANPDENGPWSNLPTKHLPVLLKFTLNPQFYKKIFSMVDDWSMSVSGYIARDGQDETGVSESERVRISQYATTSYFLGNVYLGREWLGPELIEDPQKVNGPGTVTINNPHPEVEYTIRIYKSDILFAVYCVPPEPSFPVVATLTDEYRASAYIIDEKDFKMEIASMIFTAGDALFLTQEGGPGNKQYVFNQIRADLVADLPKRAEVSKYKDDFVTTPMTVRPTFGLGSSGAAAAA